jgi:hypothetical protein
MRKNILLSLSVLIAVLATALFISCGGGGGGGGGVDAGSVAFYVTDSPEDDYKQVTTAINSVQLVHKGSGDTCDVLSTPVTVDITDLSSMLQLLNMVSCPARSYNRMLVEFDEQVVLTDMNDTTANCNFTSYKDKGNNPNVLQCNGNTCFIDINGAVNVFANQNNELALDFELKDFEVMDFNLPSCSVTIKVSPLHASDIEKKHNDGYDEGISGYIISLNNSEQSFTMTSESGTFTVSYDNVTTQQGIDDILNLAASDQLKVKVEASSINLDTKNIVASAIYVEVEGTVSNLDITTKTFTLTYQTSKTITVDYNNAEVEGILVDNANVQVKLNGYDGSNYLSKEVEVEN